ncbi:hypothetical protein KUTeg_010524 [Tegillarca granosa]|uniref:Sodium-dependent multivitamin transporter n=1 Tax=Tegillarca granosa TaxID=220873 RepID=A0ABQ9F3E6_TEGGR|nr:hypothetical protein KUTeg_010524 [Tegillarca granosa]
MELNDPVKIYFTLKLFVIRRLVLCIVSENGGAVARKEHRCNAITFGGSICCSVAICRVGWCAVDLRLLFCSMLTFQTISMAIRAFGVWDYVIFAFCLGFSICIGIYHAVAGGRQKTTSEYYFGNRQMGLVPVALSLLVTYQSSIFLLGYPAETYIYGSMFWLSFSGVTIGFIMIALIIVPLFHPLERVHRYK